MELSDVGASEITDSSGDMLLKNINGSLDINDSSGEIRVVSVTGNVRWRTAPAASTSKMCAAT